jgi:hypothetical protein
LLDGEYAVNLLTDQGFRSAAWARTWAAESGVHLLLAPSRTERAARIRPPAVRQFVAAFRNRIETATDTLKDRFHPERTATVLLPVPRGERAPAPGPHGTPYPPTEDKTRQDTRWRTPRR